MPFGYYDGHLWAGKPGAGQDLLTLARSYDRPLYVYSLPDVTARARRLRAVFDSLPISLHYAMKANANADLLKSLAREGHGVDTVSGSEIEDAMLAGFEPEKIIFSGVGKTKMEIELAIRHGIKQINVESPQELARIGQIATHLNKKINVAFRMNPDVNPQTHPYITTGFRENKFGMDESFLPELKELLRQYEERVVLRGLTFHIGSQVTGLSSFREAIEKTILVYQSLRSEGYPLDRFDIGGGLSVDYSTADVEPEHQLMQDYGRMARELLAPLKCEIMIEPGRILVARAGLLIGEVQYVKSTAYKNFAILNTGMHHLLRPALYQAVHRVLPLEQKQVTSLRRYDVVGPICESSDFLARDVTLPLVASGDYLAIADTGAYGYSMASLYNRHALPLEIVLTNVASHF